MLSLQKHVLHERPLSLFWLSPFMQQETHQLPATGAADRFLAHPCPQPEATTGNRLPGLRGRHGDHRDDD